MFISLFLHKRVIFEEEASFNIVFVYIASHSICVLRARQSTYVFAIVLNTIYLYWLMLTTLVAEWVYNECAL